MDYYSRTDNVPITSFKDILHPLKVKSLVDEWILEDTSGLDIAAVCLSRNETSSAKIIVKQTSVLCGIPFCQAIFDQLNCQVSWNIEEGSEMDPYSTVATVSGNGKDILLAERIVLNVLARASGVATVSRRVSRLLKDSGWKGSVAATRKTTPGFRLVEKYSSLVGGIATHRYNLSDMVMLKDNHIKIVGSVERAVKLVKATGCFHLKIEVECSSLEDAMEAAKHGADIVMLDNFDCQNLNSYAAKLKSSYPNVIIEASGNIKEDNILDYAFDSVDIISSSMFIQGYQAIDFSMKITST